MKKTLLNFIILLSVILGFSSISFAGDKLAIVISGQAHSSLYPCTCPYNPTGGVARRATLINEIRKENKNILVLEDGGSFAGGSYDITSQTTELDEERTKFYMQSLVEMSYDAFLVSSKEFSFGDNFLKNIISKYKLNYLSVNLGSEFKPYVIKEFNNVKIAIVGITDKDVKDKTKVPYSDPQNNLSNIIKEIKENKKADFIIVLSYLSQKDSEEIIRKVGGIDVWVSSNNPFLQGSNQDVGGTQLIVPAWQVRSLTKATLDLDTLKIEEVAHIELNKDINDDTNMLSIIPSCFSDKDCHKQGFTAKCKNEGTKKSKCDFSEIKPIKLTIIKPASCKTCNIDNALVQIRTIIASPEVQYLEGNNKAAKDLIEKFNIKMLPAYLIEKPIYGEEVISKIKQISKEQDVFYVLEPGFTGVSYFAGREKIQNRLDLFFDIGTKDIVKILDVLRVLKSKRSDIDIHLNFLAIEDSELGLIAKGEKYEVEEFLRGACISKYYPNKVWDYLSCRLSDIGSSWWDDCVIKFDMDPSKIKECARTQEGSTLLKDFIKLTQELEVVFGPTFLINNQEIFSSEGAPTVEELEELFSAQGTHQTDKKESVASGEQKN